MKTIPLSQGKEAIVDDEDYQFLIESNWTATKRSHGFYAYRGKDSGGWIYMHQIILGKKDDLEVDHINGDGLDNRRENLRFVTRQQNCWNAKGKSGGFKGATFSKEKGLWAARIYVSGHNRHIGYFKEEEDAAIAYNVAAQLFRGEFARLNDV